MSLEKGQFKCANNCMVGVGSDSDDPMILHGSMPSGDSGNTLFLTGSDASKLVEMLINAKKLMVLTSYASGNKVAVFDASGFDFSRLKTPVRAPRQGRAAATCMVLSAP